MRYRSWGPRNVQVSALSFGCGRLPEDDDASTALIQAAVAAGCNYFETASFYCNGQCQQKTGLGLRGLTDRAMVSAKIGVEPATTAESYRKELDRQLSVLGVDRVPWLMVGWLSLENLPHLTKKGGALEAIEQARSEGLIDHLGFTGHDTPDNFIEILKTGLFESMTVSYHILNRTYEPAIAVARALGVGVVAMNPVGGGVLSAPAPELQRLLPRTSATTAALALRFVLANPGVSTACSGMATLAQVQENAATVDDAPDAGDADYVAMTAVLDQFKALGDRFCTGCRYCMDCPHGVDIPGNFHLYNLATVYGLRDHARASYGHTEPGKRASACTRCGDCEAKCPNQLPIIAQLDTVRGLFEAV
jgi:predicted aldo/keto reductase-like oxidoreductase